MSAIIRSQQTIVLIILALCGSFVSASANEKTKDLTPSYEAIKAKAMAEQDRVVAEAATAVTKTQQALTAIEEHNTKNALALLQDAVGELDIILAKYPAMELVSANIDTNVVDLDGTVDTVKKAIDAADDFLDDGKVQYARQILDELISEVRITTTSIPLKTFPAAIKTAVALLANNQANDAATTLYKALHTLDVTTEIIPLPVIKAELLLTEASEIEHKQSLTKEQRQQEVSRLADAATDQLKIAQLLGYGEKDDYQFLYSAIDDFKDEVFAEKSYALWSSIKQNLTTLKNKLTFFKK